MTTYNAWLAGLRARPRVGGAPGERTRHAGAAPARGQRRRHRRRLPRVRGRCEQREFARPTPGDLGDAHAAGLLRTALRIGFRSGAGPFRSLAGIAVEPRAYQLVPLMMALRQRAVRLLISDDVGIGKTVEAGLIAAELLAQGSARRLAVLCSPALAEQWQGELRSKFGIDAELVLASTVSRLERDLATGPVAVRPAPARGGLHRLHQVDPPPRRLRPALPRPGDRRRGAHLRGGRRAERRRRTSCATSCCARSPRTPSGTCCW